jgi:hypothetical protein
LILYTGGFGNAAPSPPPDTYDRCEQGVLPEVVGLPPCDLVEQAGLDSDAQCRRCQHSELELAVFPAGERAPGQESLPYPLQGHRILPAGPAPVERVGGQAEEDLGREGVVARMQGR